MKLTHVTQTIKYPDRIFKSVSIGNIRVTLTGPKHSRVKTQLQAIEYLKEALFDRA